MVLFPILFFISQTSYRTYKIISRYELARPIMGTIFLVIHKGGGLFESMDYKGGGLLESIDLLGRWTIREYRLIREVDY